MTAQKLPVKLREGCDWIARNDDLFILFSGQDPDEQQLTGYQTVQMLSYIFDVPKDVIAREILACRIKAQA